MAYGDPTGKRKRRRITKLDVLEVSLVDRPANGEPFCLYKSEDGTPEPQPEKVTEIPYGIQKFATPEPVKETGAPVDYDKDSVSASLDMSKAVMDRVLSGLTKS